MLYRYGRINRTAPSGMWLPPCDRGSGEYLGRWDSVGRSDNKYKKNSQHILTYTQKHCFKCII